MNTEQSNAGQGTILVVDDDSSTRRALRVTLTGMGFTVVEAARGEEALSLARVSWFDAVLLDVDMPGMGGVEACRCIRRAVARLPILMLTVMDSEDDKVLALDAGADDYITKPFQVRELTARLRSAVRRRNVQETNRDAPIRHGQLELDPPDSSDAKGIRGPALPDDARRRADSTRPPAEVCMGTGVWKRARVPSHIYPSTAQENRR